MELVRELGEFSKDTKDMVKTRNQENPPETPERKYVEESVFSKDWWKQNLLEQVSTDKLLSVAKDLTRKYGVRAKIKLVPKLGNKEQGYTDYAHFDFDKKTMLIAKKATTKK